MQHQILFEGALTTKHYLHTLLLNYPFDIEESLVYSLISKDPFPHPALIQFITYFKDITKIIINTTDSLIPSSSLLQLMQKMSILSQYDVGVSHIHNYNFQVTIHLSKFSLSHPYAHLPFHKISLLDSILLHETVLLHSVPFIEYPILNQKIFIFKNISIDHNKYIAIPIQITDKHGIIFLSKDCISLAVPLCAMYHRTPPTQHYDFILLFGYADSENCLEYYNDETNQLQIGCARGDCSMYHFQHLKHMILTLYNSLCIRQSDYPIHASMIQLTIHDRLYALLFLGHEGAGKSAILQSITQQCKKAKIESHIIFDDQATLHNLDNEIKITQVELSNYELLSIQTIHDTSTYSNSIFIHDEQSIYQIHPCITFEESKQFHPLTHIFYLDPIIQTTINTIDTIEAFKQLWSDIHQDEASLQLQNDFITMFFVKNIPIYHVSTKGTKYQKIDVLNRIAKRILTEIQL